jgi:hypothetical protein
VEGEADRFRRDHRHHREAPVALLVDGCVHALHTDHRGAPTAVTDPDQKVIWRARYAPFDAAAANEDPNGASRDLADGNKTGERVLEMAKYVYRYLGQLQETKRSGIEINPTLNFDSVAFSRGAASAPIFANLIERLLAGDDEFIVTEGDGGAPDIIDFNTLGAEARTYLANSCLNVSLRFLGLWDTVSHLGIVEYNDSKESYGEGNGAPYRPGPGYVAPPVGNAYFGIPASVDFTAHAVTVNERRKVFDGLSIYENPRQSGGNKIEKGFVGAHADIGGGYPDSDLSDVAFMWMVQQAKTQGGLSEDAIDATFIIDKGWHEVTRPEVNNQVYHVPEWYIPDGIYRPGRHFRYLDDGSATDILQDEIDEPEGARNLDFESALAFLEEDIYQDNNLGAVFGNDQKDNTVLKKGADGTYLYQKWLEQNYGINVDISNEDLEG